MKKEKTEVEYAGREFVITREYAAPREMVFEAWTDPEQLAKWWGPGGFTCPVCEWAAVRGKDLYVVMRGPNGVDYPMGGRFEEVAGPGRLVFTCGPLDEKKNLIFEFRHSVTFTEARGKTLLTIHARVLRTTPGASRYIAGFEAGMTQSLERLAGSLPRC